MRPKFCASEWRSMKYAMACAWGVTSNASSQHTPACGQTRDVADHVAAGLAGGDSDRGQPPHEVRRVIDVDEMALEVLPGRHMKHSDRVLLRNVGEFNELVGRQPAHRDLDPLHLDPVLALPVDAVGAGGIR